MPSSLNSLHDYISRNQQEYASVLLPGKYIAQGTAYDLPYAVSYLQNRFRSALFFFVNGSYWLKNIHVQRNIICDTCGSVDSHTKNIVLELYPVISKVHNKFGVFSQVLEYIRNISSSPISYLKMATVFRLFYNEFEQIVPTLKAAKVSWNKCRSVLDDKDYEKKDLKYLQPLFKLKKYSNIYFKDLLKGFILHGSLASMDYIRHWSDVDTLMIVKKGTIRNPEKLMELRKRSIQSHKYLFQIDPYQLHGHLLISEFDLDYFSQTYFPSELLGYSKSFFDENAPVEFSQRDCYIERLSAFWYDAVKYFIAKAIKFKSQQRDLFWNREKKLFIHRLLTFPLFYLQAKGIHVYKKYSFIQAEKDFSEDVWQVVRDATDFMNLWKSKCRYQKQLQIMDGLNSTLYYILINIKEDIRFFLIDKQFNQFHSHYDRWLQAALTLCYSGWNNVLNNLDAALLNL